MITVEKELHIAPSYNFDLLAPKERIVFFDIETTGLSLNGSALYLIGAVTWEQGGWMLYQYFAESMAEERKLLDAFFRLLGTHRQNGRVFLISYNGDGFDIPFIRSCIHRCNLHYDLTDVFSLDLLKKVRPYKSLLGLQDCRLKTVERFCGIQREDRYSGGELIYVYEEYLRLNALDPDSCEYTPLNLKLRDRLLETLLLHNAEDIADMPMIMDILGYDSLFTGGFGIRESRLITPEGREAVLRTGEHGTYQGCDAIVWDIHARLDTPLSAGIYEETPEYSISISEEDPYELNLAVTVLDTELKYFFVDYKNYYYLPAEDRAIHKSVGEFVDRRARRQATARTCYERRKGYFVPQGTPVFTPVFYREYKGQAYGELQSGRAAAVPGETAAGTEIDHELTHRYVLSVLSLLKNRKD